IDLLRKRKVTEVKEKIEVEAPVVAISPKSAMQTAIISACFILLFYLFVDFSQISKLKNELKNLTQQRQAIKHKLGALNLLELQNLKNTYQEKIQILKEAQQIVYLTPLLNALPSLLPDGVWLTRINFNFDPVASLNLDGMASLDDESKQINFVNRFFNNMKENKEFKQVFNQINLDFVRKKTVDEFNATEFRITGR
ncbi:MAG: PilN domain-containing protein, partial [Candidatus Omnitrophica bacterium]|nr:PilN domain-containing protein [Candidatus Omnitrophota bacterium]